MDVLLGKGIVHNCFIGTDAEAVMDIVKNFNLQSFQLGIPNHRGANLAGLTIKHTHHRSLAVERSDSPNHLSPLLMHTKSLVVMHIASFSADERFVNFYFIAGAAQLTERTALHSKPNAMQHEPCALLGNTDCAMNFVTADSIPAIDQ